MTAVLPRIATSVWSTYDQVARLTGNKSLRMALKQSVRSAVLGRFSLSLLPDAALSGPATVVDVGANVGDWSAAILSLVQPRQLVLFEPDPRLGAALDRRFGKYPQVTVIHKAVGRDTRAVELLQTSSSWASSTIQPLAWAVADYGPQHLTVEKRAVVEQSDLDSALQELNQIDILKIDVQGTELQVLEGAQQVLTRTRIVVVEANWRHHYEGDSVFCALHDQLVRAGFELTNLSAPNHSPEGRALWSDAFYMSTLELDQRRATRAPDS
jgi:FkbM family methyltransferase